MKTKISLAIVSVMILILSITAAYAAATWRNTAETIAPMEAEKGYFETWTDEDKVVLIRLLHEAGELPENQSVQQILNESTPMEEKGRLSDEVMTAWTGGPIDTVTFMSILETLHGPISTWSMEDKVWYSELLEKTGMLTPEDTAYILPGGGEIDQAEAIRIARETFHNAYGVSMQELDTYQAEPNFTIIEAVAGYEYYALGDRLWSIIMNNSDAKGFFTTLYHVDITNTGEVLAYIRVQDGKTGPRYLVPKAGDMAREEAIQIARNTVESNYGISSDALDDLSIGTSYWLVDRAPSAPYQLGDRVWTVAFSPAEGQAADGYQVEIRTDGHVLKHGVVK